MSAGLEAVTVTPGITAPEVSFTIPAIELCAEAAGASSIRTTTTASTNTANLALLIVLPLSHPWFGLSRLYGRVTDRSVEYIPGQRGCQSPSGRKTTPNLLH